MNRRQFYTLTAVQIVGAVALLWWTFFQPAPWTMQRSLGALLVVVGIAGIATARAQLGWSFAIRAEAHKLVTHGLYSRIRNPIYVFGIVMFTGFVLAVQRPVLLVIVPALVVGQTIRARREARVLEATFGDAYRDYRAKTWF